MKPLLGILTAGGDCPGLNAALRAAARRADQLGYRMMGIRNGFAGLEHMDVVELDMRKVSGLLTRGGSILQCSGRDPFTEEGGEARCLETTRRMGLDGLIAVGGEHTMQIAHRASRAGIPVIGIPKTIDNDVRGTEQTFGFDTAVAIATDAIDRLHSTAESHNRIMVVEVMGRSAGWIATYAGIAGGADAVLIPERPFELADVHALVRERVDRGRYFSIIVVGEGARFRGEEPVVRGRKADRSELLGGIGERVAQRLAEATGFETRVTVLGHVQRGGTPSAADRILATRYGVHAVDLAHQGRFGRMAALLGGRMGDSDLADAAQGPRLIDPEMFELASIFFG